MVIIMMKTMTNDTLVNTLAKSNELTLEEASAFTNKHASKDRSLWGRPSLQISVAKVFREGEREGEPRCWGECSRHDRITHWYQCDKPGKTRLADGSTWCGIHSPEGVAKRDQRSKNRRQQAYQKLQARSERWRKESVQNIVFPAFLEALRQIAEGYNDPRTLAREALSKWPYPLG